MWHDARRPGHRPTRRSTTGLLTALTLLVLTGCGQKGPLYMPNDSDAAEAYDPQGAYETQAPATEGDSERDGPKATPLPDAPRPSGETLPDDTSPGMRSDGDAPASEGMRSDSDEAP